MGTFQEVWFQIKRIFRYLFTFLPSYLPTFLPSYLPTFLPSYLPTFLPSYLPFTEKLLRYDHRGSRYTYELDNLGSIPGRSRDFFLFAAASGQALGSIQPPIQWAPVALSAGVKRKGRESDQSPPSSEELKNAWSNTSNPPQVFTALHLVKHRGNFTLTFIMLIHITKESSFYFSLCVRACVWSDLFVSLLFILHEAPYTGVCGALTLIRRIAATISTRLVGRGTSRVPMYCNKQKHNNISRQCH